jgi:hypothetical protein
LAKLDPPVVLVPVAVVGVVVLVAEVVACGVKAVWSAASCA